MTHHARLLFTVTALTALAVYFIASAGNSTAAGNQNLTDTINKMADAVGNNKLDEAKKLAAALKGEELEAVMNLMLIRKPKGEGLGVGPNVGAIKPDGIEKKIQELDKKGLTEKDAKEQAAALERAGYVVAAIATAVTDKCPKDKKADEKQFRTNVENLQKSALEFATAAKTSNPMQLQAAAKKLNSVCTNCHEKFKE